MSASASQDRRKFLMQAAGVTGALMIASPAAAEDLVASLLPPEPAGGKVMDVGGTKLYYLDSGGPGEVVVLLHSMTGSARSWDKQIPALTAAGYRVVSYSRRGHWGSSRIDPAAPGNGVDDLKGLLDGLGIKKFHGVGTAGGGYYLMDFAVKWHRMLQSMTLACSILAINEPEFVAKMNRGIPPGLRQLPESFREVSPAYRAADPDGLARWEALEHIARFDKTIMQPRMHGVTWQEAASITAPVMLIAGGSDLFVTPALMDFAAPHYRSCESHVISNAGHSAYWEDPRSFNALVLNFLARHGIQA